MGELKPCPFCGGPAEEGENETHLGQIYATVRCTNCSAETLPEHWNTRPIRDEAVVEKLVEAAEDLRQDFIMHGGTPRGASAGRWARFCTALEAARKQP